MLEIVLAVGIFFGFGHMQGVKTGVKQEHARTQWNEKHCERLGETVLQEFKVRKVFKREDIAVSAKLRSLCESPQVKETKADWRDLSKKPSRLRYLCSAYFTVCEDFHANTDDWDRQQARFEVMCHTLKLRTGLDCWEGKFGEQVNDTGDVCKKLEELQKMDATTDKLCGELEE